MTDRLTQLNKMIPMLEVAYQARQLRLSAIARQISELKAQIAGLDRPKSGDLSDPAVRAGADILWDTWVTDRKAKLQQEVARASSDLENRRYEVAQAFAKLNVARDLQAKLSKEARQLAERRINL